MATCRCVVCVCVCVCGGRLACFSVCVSEACVPRCEFFSENRGVVPLACSLPAAHSARRARRHKCLESARRLCAHQQHDASKQRVFPQYPFHPASFSRACLHVCWCAQDPHKTHTHTRTHCSPLWKLIGIHCSPLWKLIPCLEQ